MVIDFNLFAIKMSNYSVSSYSFIKKTDQGGEMTESQRKNSRDKTRERLIECALELFAQKGIEQAMTLDLAKKAGLSHGTVFLHFRTREELISAVVVEFGKKIVEMMEMETRSVEGLKDALLAHLRVLRSHEQAYARIIEESHSLPKDARAVMISTQNFISDCITRHAKREMDDGKLKEIPLPFLFNSWLGTVHHYLSMREFFCPGESLLMAMGDVIARNFLTMAKKEEQK